MKLSTEATIEVYYLFALEKPKPKQSTPCDEWISKIAPLSDLLDTKASSYAVGFFNGDVKLFSEKHAELLAVSEMHQDSQITDMLYFKSDKLNSNKYLVTCSELPNPELIISEV